MRVNRSNQGWTQLGVLWAMCWMTVSVEAADLKASQSFQFGSYGRVTASSDTTGGGGQSPRVVAYGPRVLEGSYSEIDFAYRHALASTGAAFDTHLTLGFGEQLFHFNGEFESQVAIRNLYLEVHDAIVAGLSVWAGSRMYRGDDVYLLDFWPLDEQNTVGGGVAYRLGRSTLRAHLGLNRLNDPSQLQRILVPDAQLGAREVVFLDRQRSVGSLGAAHHLKVTERGRLKLVAYGEVHRLPEGVWLEDDLDERALPADWGYMVGTQLGLYEEGGGSFANLFLKYGSGLGAYDEMGIPLGLNPERTTDGARELLAALSTNWENSEWGFLTGVCARYFLDADPNIYDQDDRWEVSAALRPMWFVSENVQMVAEANVQYLRPNGLSWETRRHEVPLVVQGALMPTLSLGRGSYSRPQLRLIMALSHLNEAARLTYASREEARQREYQYYVGIGAEWWFNSSRY